METIEAQILAVQKKVDACSDPEERKLLMKEKVLLMKKEEQLREERLILLRRGEGTCAFYFTASLLFIFVNF